MIPQSYPLFYIDASEPPVLQLVVGWEEPGEGPERESVPYLLDIAHAVKGTPLRFMTPRDATCTPDDREGAGEYFTDEQEARRMFSQLVDNYGGEPVPGIPTEPQRVEGSSLADGQARDTVEWLRS